MFPEAEAPHARAHSDHEFEEPARGGEEGTGVRGWREEACHAEFGAEGGREGFVQRDEDLRRSLAVTDEREFGEARAGEDCVD